MQPWNIPNNSNSCRFHFPRFIPAFSIWYCRPTPLTASPYIHYTTHTLHYIILTSPQYHNSNFFPAVNCEGANLELSTGREWERAELLVSFLSVRKLEREERDLRFILSSIRELVKSLRPDFLHPAASQSKGEEERASGLHFFSGLPKGGK